MLKTKVKASRITNLTDARYFSAWEVKYIGFNLEEGNENYIEPVKVKAMKEWLEGPEFVGEFGAFPDVEEAKQLVDALELDAVQLGHLCSLETAKELHDYEIPIIKEIVWNEHSNWELLEKQYADFSPVVDMFLLDFSLNRYDISSYSNELKKITSLHPTLIDANIEAVNIEEFLGTVEPLGLAVKGGDEEKVGYKSFDDVDDIFEALEIFV